MSSMASYCGGSRARSVGRAGEDNPFTEPTRSLVIKAASFEVEAPRDGQNPARGLVQVLDEMAGLQGSTSAEEGSGLWDDRERWRRWR